MSDIRWTAHRHIPTGEILYRYTDFGSWVAKVKHIRGEGWFWLLTSKEGAPRHRSSGWTRTMKDAVAAAEKAASEVSR